MKKPVPKKTASVRRLLLIGGPDKFSLPNFDSTRIGDSCPDILAAADLTDFDVIVVAPTPKVFTLGTREDWLKKLATQPSAVPSPALGAQLEASAQPLSSDPKAVNWENTTPALLEAFPDYPEAQKLYPRLVKAQQLNSIEAATLNTLIRFRAIERLREVLTAAVHGASILVLLPVEASAGALNEHGALDWLSPLISVRRGKDSRVTGEQMEAQDARIATELQKHFRSEPSHLVFGLSVTTDSGAGGRPLSSQGSWEFAVKPPEFDEDAAAYFGGDYRLQWDLADAKYSLTTFTHRSGAVYGLWFKTGKGNILCCAANVTPEAIAGLIGVLHESAIVKPSVPAAAMPTAVDLPAETKQLLRANVEATRKRLQAKDGTSLMQNFKFKKRNAERANAEWIHPTRPSHASKAGCVTSPGATGDIGCRT